MDKLFEGLTAVITGANGKFFLFFIIIFLLISAFFAKKGIFSISGEKIRIGAVQKQNELLLRQFKYVQTACIAFINGSNIKFPDECDEYRSLYLSEVIYDYFVEALLYNHMTTEDEYIQRKQSEVWDVVMANTNLAFFHSPEFKTAVSTGVANIIRHLVKMKEDEANKGKKKK